MCMPWEEKRLKDNLSDNSTFIQLFSLVLSFIIITNERFREQRQFTYWMFGAGRTCFCSLRMGMLTTAMQNHKSAGYKRWEPALKDDSALQERVELEILALKLPKCASLHYSFRMQQTLNILPSPLDSKFWRTGDNAQEALSIVPGTPLWWWLLWIQLFFWILGNFAHIGHKRIGPRSSGHPDSLPHSKFHRGDMTGPKAGVPE